ncbi:hypothetical protein [Streptomyces sp900116325]|uniref:hypothetical protein n=1 Tax=Streptomyces sp. 900116325 TaxID=3154295 RepID=UPI0033B90119
MNDTTPPGNHGDIWHEVGECGYCEARRSRAANAYLDEHPDAFSEMILRTGPAPTINDLFLTAAAKTDRHAELRHLLGRAIDGVVLHGESDRLRELVRGLESRVEQAEADLGRVQERACRVAEARRKAERAVDLLASSHRRVEQAEAVIARVRALHHEWKRNETDPSPGYCAHCERDEAVIPWPCPTLIALDEQQPTTTESPC